MVASEPREVLEVVRVVEGSFVAGGSSPTRLSSPRASELAPKAANSLKVASAKVSNSLKVANLLKVASASASEPPAEPQQVKSTPSTLYTQETATP